MVRRTLSKRNAPSGLKGLRTERRLRPQRRLCLEWLEPRWVLDGFGPDADDGVSAAWFQKLPLIEVLRAAPVASVASATTAGSAAAPVDDKWIIRLTDAGTSTAGSVQPVEHLLDTVAADFQVIRGLGLPGQVLVRSFAAADIARAALAANPHVAAFEPERIVSAQVLPDDPDFPSMVNLHNVGQFGSTPDADIDAPEAWDMNTGSPSVVVGVIDSGIDVTHPDLYLNVWINQGEISATLRSQLSDTDSDGRITFYDLNQASNAALVTDFNGNGYIDAIDLLEDARWADGRDTDRNGFVDDFFGWNFRVGADEPFVRNDPRDALGHGTHVAGTIGAIGNNGRGVTGVNWQSSLMSLKFLDASNQGLTSDAVLAMNYATMMRTEFGENVRVLNASWGQSGGYSPALRTALATAGQAGILFVAAAGNGNILGQGIDIDAEPFYPASYDLDNIMAVAATGPHDELARSSNYGLTSIDLAAPGVGVLSTLPGGRYGSSNGTSMAAPHVTGAAALVWSEVPDATLAEVRQAILGTVDSLSELGEKTVTGGRLNARQGVTSRTFAPRAALVAVANVTAAGGTDNLITARYLDRQGLDENSLGDGDLLVTRQWGERGTYTTTLVPGTVTASPDGTEVTATYRVLAPGGVWDALDFGDYVVSVAGGGVANRYGLTVAAAELGHFSVRIADSSIFYADTFADAVDGNLGDGFCAAANGACTLRAAIQEANAAAPAARTIILEEGTYTLSLPPEPEWPISFPIPNPWFGGPTDGSEFASSDERSGDLDVLGHVTIVGNQTQSTLIDGARLDRVFKVYPGGNLSLNRVTVTGGVAKHGGGILTAGVLELDLATVQDNAASGSGGGVAIWDGQTRIHESTIQANVADGGGAVFVCNAASVEVTASTIAHNVTRVTGGGIQSSFGGPVQVTNSTISGNNAGAGATLEALPGKSGSSQIPSVSGDGRFIAFQSTAANLIPGDTAHWNPDIVVYDRQNQTYERVSVADDGTRGDNVSEAPSISADGRFVAFASIASNLVVGDTNGYTDVFVFDRQTRRIKRVSLADDGTEANSWCLFPSISADGRFVAFQSFASNLVPGDTNEKSDIFVYDRQDGHLERVTVADDGTEANSDSDSSSLSADGRFVAFHSSASNLVTGDTNNRADVYVYDRQSHHVERVSVADDGAEGNADSSAPSLSTDGRFVAFQSSASNLVAGDANDRLDVFVYDRQAQRVDRISIADDGTEGDGVSEAPSLSADGRFVVFQSSASNLVPDDTNGWGDVFVYDRQSQHMERVSVGNDGSQGDSFCVNSSISADGRFIAFDSLASNLAPFDAEYGFDVFIYDRDNRRNESPTNRPDHPIELSSVTLVDNRGFETIRGVRIYNSLFARNVSLGGKNDIEFSSVSWGHNLFSRCSGCGVADFVDANAGNWLGPLQDNGSPTWTHALLAGSLAIDAEDRDSFDWAKIPTMDQRGVTRPQDGGGVYGELEDGVGYGAMPDIGAFEVFHSEIRGTVFRDLDGDGRRDDDEPGLPGQFVYLDANRNGMYDPGESARTTMKDDPLTATVSEEGTFAFGRLAPDSYSVVLLGEPSWFQTIAGLERASVGNDGVESDSDSLAPALSANGRFVAFASNASNLVPGDTGRFTDVFVYDRQSRRVERVTALVDPDVPNAVEEGEGNNSYQDAPAISADGRFVAFTSGAGNIVEHADNVGGAWNSYEDVLVYDLRSRRFVLASVNDYSDGNADSGFPSISADGRFVAFQSNATNLVPGDTNSSSDVFVYALQSGAMERVSVADDGGEGNADSGTPSLSADGRFVAFASSASNLAPDDTNAVVDVFVYDRQDRTIERVSVADGATQSDRASLAPSLSADGRFVAFTSAASNLVSGDTNGSQDVFVYDRQNRTVERLSVADDGGQGNEDSWAPAISGDGRFVTFTSAASNLVPGDTNESEDVFLYDRQSHRIQRLSGADDGGQADSASSAPAISADGRFVAFASSADNLLDADVNGVDDVFVAPNRNAPEIGSRSVGLFAGQVLTGVDFGLRPNPGEIRGRCFEDVIANGIFDMGEPVRAGITVYLDANGNGQLDNGEPTSQTAADGKYAFAQLESYRDYYLGVVVPDGFTLVLPTAEENGVWKVFLPAGGTVKDRDFGLRASSTIGQSENATLQGRVFWDTDGDGHMDAGESGLAGATVFLDLNDDGARQFDEPRTLTLNDDLGTPAVDEIGQYVFDHLGNRPYTARILQVPNDRQTTPVGNSFERQSYSLAVPGNALGSPQDVAVADLNGDGACDLAAAVYERNSVALLLNDGSGAFPQTPIEIPLAPADRPPDQPRGFGPVALLAADFNRSGQPDLAVVSNTSSNVAILRDFNGTSFSSEEYVTVGMLPNAVTAGDMDGDGDLDLVVTNEFDNTMSILRNNGQGGFVADPVTLAVGNHPFGVATGDFNEDGRLDLAVADFGTYPQGGDLGDVRVLLADGGFTSHTACAVGFGPAALAVKDLDGDGHDDLAVANFLSDNVTVCRGAGDGTFTAVATLPGGSGPMDIDAVDIEGDGDLDLLVTNGKSQTVGILRNRLSQGEFEFEPAESFGVANFPGASQISLAIGDLDGNETIDLVLANSVANNVAVHLNSLEPGAHRVALTGTETVSGLDFGLLPLDTTLKVASFAATSTGFVARFNRDLTASVLNLYDQGSVLGPADVTVTGATMGPVRGSLVVDPDLRKITFIKTGGPLESDTYTVTLVSGANAFRDADGNLLDGTGDGAAGDDYTATFVVPAGGSVTVSLPDFARGYGQPVNLPADNPAAGLPLQLSNGLGVSRLQMTLRYDPSLLEISAFTLSSSLAARGAVATFQVVPGGTATLDITAVGGFADTSGPLSVGAFRAVLPATAAYGAKHVLDIDALHVFDTSGTPAELPAVDDDAIHVAAFFGDNNGSRTYNAPDVTLNQRLIGLMNTGFSAYQLADPLLLADITRNGQMQANDTVSIQRVIGQVPVANVPALPTGLTPPAATGADPKMHIPQDMSGSPGNTVEVPVMLLVTEAAGITLSGFDLAIEFDPGRFTVSDVQLGSLVGGLDFVGLWTNPAPGQLLYTASSATGTGLLLADTEGSLVTVTLTIGAGAVAGPAAINLLASFQTTATAAFDNELNELVLAPAPSNAADDSVDGLLTITGAASDPPPAQNPDQPLDTNDDGGVTAADVLAVINYLNRGLPQDASVLYVEPGRPIMYGDVNGDRWITAQDALAVINDLNAQVAPGGEGEAQEAALWALLDEGEDDSLWELLAEDQLGRGEGRTDFNPFGTE